MNTVEITKEQVERAKTLYPFEKLDGSITKGKSKIYGALGEIIIYDIAQKKGLRVDFNSTYDYDLLIEGYRIDVKTKRTTVAPRLNYLCSISSFNTRQKCDYYFFLRVNESLKHCYLLGYKQKESFFEEATFNKKGSIDVNGWAFKDDCYNLEVQMLNKFKVIC